MLAHQRRRRSLEGRVRQYGSIRYTERLEAGIEPSIGSVGDSYDALAETVIGLFKTAVIRRRAPWRILRWWCSLRWNGRTYFNHRCLHEPIGNIPPAEAETRAVYPLQKSLLLFCVSHDDHVSVGGLV